MSKWSIVNRWISPIKWKSKQLIEQLQKNKLLLGLNHLKAPSIVFGCQILVKISREGCKWNVSYNSSLGCTFLMWKGEGSYFSSMETTSISASWVGSVKHPEYQIFIQSFDSFTLLGLQNWVWNHSETDRLLLSTQGTDSKGVGWNIMEIAFCLESWHLGSWSRKCRYDSSNKE